MNNHIVFLPIYVIIINMSLYIKLIQPKMLRRPMDSNLKIRMSPPLGLLTIASMLKDKHKIVIQNENVESIIYDSPDIVGISVTVDVLPRAIEIAKIFRQKGIKVVAGGIHITTAYKTIPENSFDVLCVGAAEGTWNKIISDYENNSLQSIYFCNSNFTGNHIISPAYELIEKKKYLYFNIVSTSRGCPFKCDFCYNSGEHHYYINRRIDDVLKDIKAINRKHIMFIDDNFFGNKEWLLAFLDKIKPFKIKWNAAASINIAFDTALLDLMVECGLQGLFIGFESINSSSINNVHKIQNQVNKYEEAISNLHERGIMINASFVFGLDSDTPEVFQKTLDWIVKNKIETVTSHILTPYPGTELYNKLSRENRITNYNLSYYNTAHVVYEPKLMSQKELYNGYLWIYKKIYSWKNIIKRIPKSQKQILPYLLFNIFYRKFGKFTDFLCSLFSYERIGYFAEKFSKYL